MATLTLQQQCSSVQQQGMYDLLDANNTTMGAHKRVYNEVADMVSQGGSKHKVLTEEHTTQGTHRGTHNTRYSQRNTQHKVLTEEHTTQGTHRGTHNTRYSQRDTQHKVLTEGHTTQGTHRGTHNTRYSQRNTQHKVLTEERHKALIEEHNTHLKVRACILKGPDTRPIHGSVCSHLSLVSPLCFLQRIRDIKWIEFLGTIVPPYFTPSPLPLLDLQ